MPGPVSTALAGAAADNWLDVSTIRRKVTGIVVDGDTAVALESKTATTHGGEQYRNDYGWVCTCRGLSSCHPWNAAPGAAGRGRRGVHR